MDNILNRLNYLSNLAHLLNDRHKIEFDEEIRDNIRKVNILLSDIENILSHYEIPKEKINKFNEDENKTNRISKILFPFYWNLSQRIPDQTLLGDN
jgi:hypothetical protein